MKSTYSSGYQRLLSRLISARKAARLTQQELAKRIKRPQSFISKYENAERRLDVVQFVQVCQAVSADPVNLLDELAESLKPLMPFRSRIKRSS